MPTSPKRISVEEKLVDLRQALLQCRSVSPNSEAMRFALQTVDDVKQGRSAYDSREANGKATDKHANAKNIDPKYCAKTSRSKNQSRGTIQFRILHTIFVLVRFVIIEFPLVLAFTLVMCAHMLSHVYEEYLDPQFDLMTYTDLNRTQDITFYERRELTFISDEFLAFASFVQQAYGSTFPTLQFVMQATSLH